MIDYSGFAFPKGATRRDANDAEDRSERADETRWKAEVWRRDEGICRVCGRRVVKSLKKIGGRGEVHHVTSRVHRAVRWDARNGLLCCGRCHDRLERNELVILATGTQMFVVNRVSYIDARQRLKFQKVS